MTRSLTVFEQNRIAVSVRQQRKNLLAGAVGNFIEWYELVIYGFLTSIMAETFFSFTSASKLTDLTTDVCHLCYRFFLSST